MRSCLTGHAHHARSAGVATSLKLRSPLRIVPDIHTSNSLYHQTTCFYDSPVQRRNWRQRPACEGRLGTWVRCPASSTRLSCSAGDAASSPGAQNSPAEGQPGSASAQLAQVQKTPAAVPHRGWQLEWDDMWTAKMAVIFYLPAIALSALRVILELIGLLSSISLWLTQRTMRVWDSMPLDIVYASGGGVDYLIKQGIRTLVRLVLMLQDVIVNVFTRVTLPLEERLAPLLLANTDAALLFQLGVGLVAVVALVALRRAENRHSDKAPSQPATLSTPSATEQGGPPGPSPTLLPQLEQHPPSGIFGWRGAGRLLVAAACGALLWQCAAASPPSDLVNRPWVLREGLLLLQGLVLAVAWRQAREVLRSKYLDREDMLLQAAALLALRAVFIAANAILVARAFAAAQVPINTLAASTMLEALPPVLAAAFTAWLWWGRGARGLRLAAGALALAALNTFMVVWSG